MPAINVRGEVLFGRDLAWLTDDAIVGAPAASGFQVATAPSLAGPWTLVPHARGASAVAGNGYGHWFAHLVGYGVYDEHEWLGADLALGADLQAARALAAPDGTVPLLLAYSRGEGLRLLARDGSLVDYPDVHPKAQVAVVDHTRALFVDWVTGQVETVGGLPHPRVVPGPLFWPTVLDHAGELWLFYHSASRIVLHPFTDASRGFVFPAGFYPHARLVDGKAVVAWAVGPDDATGESRVIDLDHDPRVSLLESAPAFSVAPFTHPVLIAPFKDLAGESGAPAEIVVNQMAQAVARPCFAAEDSLGQPFLGELLGIYSEATDPTAALALAAVRGTRLLLVNDTQTAPWTFRPGLRPWDIPGVELYWFKRLETLPQAVARWFRDVAAMLAAWPGDCAVVPQYYCMGGAPPNEDLTVAEVLQAVAHLTDLVNLSTRIKVVAPFAWSRANGITGHPELRAAFAALLRAAPGLPTLTAVGAPVPPQPKPPTPQPPSPLPTPKEIRMFVDITKPLIDAVQGTKVANDDGTVSVKCDDGYLSIDSTGAIHFAPAIGGDEKFVVAGDVLVSINMFNGTKIKLLPFRESA